jgi:hypothetical protein
MEADGMITIEARAVGRKQALVPEWAAPLPPELRQEGARLTLRDLLAGVVRAEVRAFRERQEARRLLQVLTEAQIAAGAAGGKIDMGGRDLQQEVDEGAAVETALQAFEDGLYLVILDGRELRSLDEEIALQQDSRLTFLRLTMLAGG